ncbi:MAG: polysaccharide biosynthesis tyrosine autokinase [Candidatus Competibacteraceae bacterium]
MNAKATLEKSIENIRLIVVTSASPGEGKTFTAFNLAMTIANGRDTKALLVDGDLISRALSKLCELSDSPGLTDYLLGTQPALDRVIVNTNVSGLQFIPAGSSHPDATELLASEKMEYLANDLANRYSDRLVVLDAPPLLASMQSLLLASLAGQVLVVVEEGKTPRKAIKEAVSLLDDTAIVGIVLNRCRYGFNNPGYNYSYRAHS